MTKRGERKETPCKKEMKKFLLILISALLLVGFGIFLVLTKPHVIDFFQTLTASSDASAESSSSSASTSAESDSSEIIPPKLTEITVSEPNNLGYSGYMQKTLMSGEKRYTVYKQVLDSYNLVPYVGEDGQSVVLDTGHKVYQKSGSDDNQLYVVSGAELLPVKTGWEIDTSMSVKLRKEGTGERIRVYTDEEEYNLARENYEKGQAILAGLEEVPEKCVILNGMYLPSVQYEVHDDGRTYLPMTQIAEAYDEQSEFYDVEGWLNVAVDLRYIVIPTDLAPKTVKDHFSVKGQSWTYSNEGYPLWSDTFYLPQTDQTEMPLEDIARIFGWKISVGDNIVNIVTDELDNNDNFVLHKVNSDTTYYSLNDLPEKASSDSTSSSSSTVSSDNTESASVSNQSE